MENEGKEKLEDMNILEKTTEETEKLIKEIVKDGIAIENIEYLYQLIDIHKDIKEEESMNYGNYGNYGANYGNYGNYGANYGNNYGANYGRGAGYDSYGRRGVDSKYRGEEEMNRMAGEYGRYQDSRNRYGAGDQETDKSFHYMVKALEDFIKVLHEEAETPQQKQQLMQSLQNSMR